jgi:hypothetical protein
MLILSNGYSQESFSDELFSINGISFEEMDFTKNYLYGGLDYVRGLDHTSVTIHGWSRNGNLFYSIDYYRNIDYYIKNLIDDEIIWCGYEYNFKTDDASKRLISEIIERFNIEPYVGEIGEFPFILNDELYDCFGTNQRNSGLGLSSYLIDINIEKNGDENNIKIINTIYAHHSWRHNNIIDNLKYWYVKSPFENRIAVIVLIPQTHQEWDYPYYGIDILGCHLGVGFY